MARGSILLTCVCMVACGGGDDDAAVADAAVADAPLTGPDAPSSPDAPPAADAAPMPDAAPPIPGLTCDVPIDLTGEVAPVAESTAMVGVNAHTGSCAPAFGPERYFVYDAGASAVDLIIDALVDEAAMTPYDVVLSARTTCSMADSELGCSDRGWGERLELPAVTGLVSIHVDGSALFGANKGDFTIQVRKRAIAGDMQGCDPAGLASRCDTGLACDPVAATCAPTSPAIACAAATDLTGDLADGAATVTDSIPSVDPDHTSAGCAFDPMGVHPERRYRFTIAAPRHLTASTVSAATNFDTVVSLRSADCETELHCNGDADAEGGEYRASLDVPSLPAGTYVLVVEADSDLAFVPADVARSFRLDVTLAP